MQIAKPKCDWGYVQKLDKRRKGTWFCRSCKAIRHQKTKPECACANIEL